MLFGWKVKTSALLSTVFVALGGLFFWAVSYATPTMPASLDVNWMVLAPAFWLICFVYGCLLDNTGKL